MSKIYFKIRNKKFWSWMDLSLKFFALRTDDATVQPYVLYLQRATLAEFQIFEFLSTCALMIKAQLIN